MDLGSPYILKRKTVNLVFASLLNADYRGVGCTSLWATAAFMSGGSSSLCLIFVSGEVPFFVIL